MNREYDVTIIGAAIVDILVQPIEVGELTMATQPVDNISMNFGGDGGNEAAVLGKLGKKVNLLTKLGNDLSASLIRDQYAALGVSTADTLIDDTIPTGINVVMVNHEAERSFITNEKSSLREFYPSDLKMEAIGKADILCLGSIFVSVYFDDDAMADIFARAKAAGCTVCADMKTPRHGETFEDIRKCLSYVDYTFPNYEEACALTGLTDLHEIAELFLDAGVGCLIIKTGAEGCHVFTKEEHFLSPSYPVEHCIDTTGAGDNFAAGFLYALSEGMSLRDCCAFANATASISVEHVGTRGVQSLEEVMERFRVLRERS